MRTSLLFIALICAFSPSVAEAQQQRCPSPVTKMTMEKGQYSPVEGATFDLQDFAANMVAKGKASPLCFQRTTDVLHGQAFISSESLTKLFAQKIKQADKSMSDLKVEISGDSAHISGKVHKGIEIPFEIEGPVSTDGTVLILHTKKIKAEGIPVKGLLGMVGVNLGSLLGSDSVDGVVAKGNTLVFQPAKIASLRGRITNARISTAGLTITFGQPAQQQQKTGN